MFTSLSLIQPVASVTVTTSPNNDLVKVEFAHDLDKDMRASMLGLNNQPFVRFLRLSSCQKMFDITVNSNYSLSAVADEISKNLEGHGLKVRRLSGLVEKSELKSFTAQ